MISLPFKIRSIKARVTLFTLLIFLASLWTLSFYASRMLRDDMQRLAGEQQFTTAHFVASQVNEQLIDRIAALEGVAHMVEPTMLGNANALQSFLEQRPILPIMFNGGTFITDAQATARASLPVSVGRVGINFMGSDHVAGTLKDGKAHISKPLIAKVMKTPIFAMAVPIRDAQGQVIGTLVGVIDLSQPSFLSSITDSPYGQTGGYLLVDSKTRLIITATDKRRILEELVPGVNPLTDRFILGFGGSGVAVNPMGVEVLASGHTIPIASWHIVVSLPTSEAFAPINDMQFRMLQITLGLTLLAGLLTWWMLRRELSPLLSTVHALARTDGSGALAAPLPIARQDEVGDLIGGFNRLLQILSQRDAALKTSELRLQTIIKTEPECIKIVNAQGQLMEMNPAGLAMIEADSLEQVAGRPVLNLIAAPYRDAFVALHQRVIAGESAQLEFEVIGLKGGHRWLETHATPMLDRGKPVHLAVTRDITERKQAEQIAINRMNALIASMDSTDIPLEALLNTDEMQRLQDEFATAHGVASIITHPDGTPFTRSSNFTQLCSQIIRNTELGCANCYKSDANIGRYHPEGPVIQPCMSGGLWDAGASITVGGHHVANWLIGQVRDSTQTENKMRPYAHLIGADESAFMQAFRKVPEMTQAQFTQVANQLYALANQLPPSAFHDPDQARFIAEHKHTQRLEQFRTQTLALLASDASLEHVLEALVLGVQEVSHGALCSVLLLSSDGKHLSRGVAPGLPDFYNAAIDGIEIGLGVGSCGTAAFTGERVVVEDIQTHPYWAPYKELAAQAGLQACWSQPIRAAGGQVLGTFAIYHRQPHAPDADDIGMIEQSANLASIAIEKRHTAQTLRLSEQRLALAVSGANEGIWDLDLLTGELYHSPGMVHMLGYTPEELPTQRKAWDAITNPDDVTNFRHEMGQHFKNPDHAFDVLVRLRHKDGRWRWLQSRGQATRDAHGRAVRFSGTQFDVTERKQLEDQVRQLAYFDALTGMPNRRLLDDRLNHAMAASKRSGLYGALMFLDLDNFKPLNDTYGHGVGDLLLIEVASRLSACVRETDTVARLGGDEFVVMLSELDADKAQSTEQAAAVAEKIRASLAAPYLLTVAQLGEQSTTVEHHCTTSIGVAMFLNHEASQSDLMKWADSAMYQAKDAGRNAIRFYGLPS